MSPKRILFVYHNNFLNNAIGCNNYFFQFVDYVKRQGCIVDYFSVTNVWNNFENFEELNAKFGNLVDNLYLYTPDPDAPENAATEIREEKFERSFSLFGIPLWKNKHTNRASAPKAERPVLGWAQMDVLRKFEELVNTNHYDVIDVHYLQMAEYIYYANIPEDTKVVYSSQDAFYMMCGFYQQGLNAMAGAIPYEIKILERFDAISCISFDEMFFYQKLLPGKKFYHLPHPISERHLPEKAKDIDVLLLGFDNPHNCKGLVWFIDEVLPHLGKEVRVTVCGKVWATTAKNDPEHIKRAEAAGVSHIDFAEDLDELYSRTRISMCPLLGGTGMKIKVIDSLARGIPVVTTLWGVDGFSDKHNNGCLVHDDPVEFADAINRLVRNDELYKHTAEIARSYFREYLSLEANQEKLNKIFDL